MRIFFWLFDSVIHAMYCFVKYVSKDDPTHSWRKYNVDTAWGRFNFQMDLGHALIAKGIEMDCPHLADLKDKECRLGYMRKQDWVPCACKRCSVCLRGLTHGVAHKPKFSW